jgi:hypothetical protein
VKKRQFNITQFIKMLITLNNPMVDMFSENLGTIMGAGVVRTMALYAAG